MVVSLLLAIRGDRTSSQIGSIGGKPASDLGNALQQMGSDVMSEGGDLLIAAELLWTPSEADEMLERRDAFLDYPELIEF